MRDKLREEVYFHVQGLNSQTGLLDLAAQELSDCILDAAKTCIPVIDPVRKAKAWWTPELHKLRK